MTSCSLEVLPVSTVSPVLGFILLGLLLGTVSVLVGLLTLISRVATGFVALLLGPFGRCPVVCMHCFVVLVFALMLIVTSISSGWLGSVFGPFFAGFVGTCSLSCVLIWLPCVAQRLAVSVPCFACLSISCVDLLSRSLLTSSVGSCGVLCRGIIGVLRRLVVYRLLSSD